MKGFYKKGERGELNQAVEIHTPEGTFTEDNKTEAPEEWLWFDSSAEAYLHFSEKKAVSKLTIMRRLQDLGKWQGFKAMLLMLPEESQDAWTLAMDIAPDDPLFLAHGDAIKEGLELTDEQFNQILTP